MTSSAAAAAGISSTPCTSEMTGTSSSCFTFCRIAVPSVTPGPWYVSAEERLSFKYDDLKMKGIDNFPAIFLIFSPIRSTVFSPSMTHGPAINTSGLLPPMAIESTWTTFMIHRICWNIGYTYESACFATFEHRSSGRPRPEHSCSKRGQGGPRIRTNSFIT